MPRSLFLSGMIYALLIVGLGTMSGALLALAIPLVLYVGASLLYGPAPLQLRVVRRISDSHVAPGTHVQVGVTVTNAGGRLELLLLEERWGPGLTLVAGQVGLLTGLEPGASVSLEYTLSGGRGCYELPGLTVSAADLLGLFRRHAVLGEPVQLVVLPEIVPLRQLPMRPRRTRAAAGMIPARQGGPGVTFFGVREYRPGDPPHLVNERISARSAQTLFVNQFEQERAAEIALIVDARQRSNVASPHGTLFDHSVTAAASLAVALLTGGNRVGMLLYGGDQQWTLPGYGRVQRERLLRALSEALPGGRSDSQPMEALPVQLFKPGSQLVLVSPLLNGDLPMLVQLRAQGFPLLVLSPDPIAFEQNLLVQSPVVKLATRAAGLERELLLRKLRQAGVQVLEWQVDLPLQQVAQAVVGRAPTWVNSNV